MTRRYIPVEVIRRVREAAKNRCGFCLTPQRLYLGPLEVEHIYPYSLGGTDDEENLWLTCRVCNGHKAIKTHEIDPETQERVPLFNPRTQNWWEHFTWSEDFTQIIGLTAIGRATVIALELDSDFYALQTRAEWVALGWKPPTE